MGGIKRLFHQPPGEITDQPGSEVNIMIFDETTADKIDALYDSGRAFVERNRIHGVSIEYEFDTCAFEEWRRKVNDLLFSMGGCEDLYYQRFSKEVTRPHVKDLEEGLRILSATRDDVDRAIAQQAGKRCRDKGCTGMSVSYH
jgi:hypothetical protein